MSNIKQRLTALATVVSLTTASLVGPGCGGAPDRQEAEEEQVTAESHAFTAVAEDGRTAAGVITIEGEQLRLVIDGQEQVVSMHDVPEPSTADGSTLTWAMPEGEVAAEVLNDTDVRVRVGDTTMTLTFPEGLPQDPSGDPTSKPQGLVAIIFAGALAGALLVATCGLYAKWTCGSKGVKKWYVYSYEKGLCYVECW